LFERFQRKYGAPVSPAHEFWSFKVIGGVNHLDDRSLNT
jgi:hypothetical protein